MTNRGPLLASLGLVIIGVVAGGMSTWVWSKTATQIAVNERSYRLRALNEIVPPARYDNNLFDDIISIRDRELLGSDDPVTVYRARKDGAPVAAILTAVAPKGFSGAIHLLVGVYADGTLAGVRVSMHRETAGLGDQIEIEKSNWITVFDRRSLADPLPANWFVRKDGGEFDQISGATITPRAIVKAIHDALLYFEANRELLFAE
ncbi:MAG: electron transport complex subunit RsxG [Gammaproteobacteria bacterium]|nr:electron transport complex subunit RsxG [Gammaproteobacteria bacterium]